MKIFKCSSNIIIYAIIRNIEDNYPWIAFPMRYIYGGYSKGKANSPERKDLRNQRDRQT